MESSCASNTTQKNKKKKTPSSQPTKKFEITERERKGAKPTSLLAPSRTLHRHRIRSGKRRLK